MRKKSSLGSIILIVVIICSICIFAGITRHFFSYQNISPTPENEPYVTDTNIYNEDCSFTTTVPDLEGSETKNPVITFCQNRIRLSKYGITSEIDGFDIETDQTFNKLFYSSQGGRHRVPQQLEATPIKNLGTVLKITTYDCGGSDCSTRFGVYLLKDMHLDPILKIGNEREALNHSVDVYKTNPLVIKVTFYLGYFGCHSGCRYSWSNFYHWDASKKELILANNKHQKEMNTLMQEYKKMNQTTCQKYTSKTLIELYPERKNAENFCDDKADLPIDSKQVELFLQAYKTLDRIIKGENLSDHEIIQQVI